MRYMTGRDYVDRLRERKLVLPPLAGYTDYPYRRILAEHGAPFICAEMVNCEAVIRGNPRTQKMLMKPEGTQLNGAQLFGEDPAMMAAAAEIIEYLGFDYVDINMGCAVKAITQNGAGVSLMGEPEKAATVVSRVVDAVSIPVIGDCHLSDARFELSRDFENPHERNRGIRDKSKGFSAHSSPKKF